MSHESQNSVLSRGLYVHVPFCAHKCGYCDFNSWAEERREPQERWLKTLLKQAEFWSEKQIAFDTVFWGGGTPSLLQPDILERAILGLQKFFCFAPDTEWTLECNPETLSRERLEHMWSLGVNRISVGVQSFENIYLDRLERRARREDNISSLELVQKHWKGRWSLDLMFGLPEQSPQMWRDELETALSFAPQHISAYQLTLTTARSRNWQQPNNDVLSQMFLYTEERLERAGLPKYEVSNFAVPTQECRHNLKYWNLEPFLGLGPGASGLLNPAWVDSGEASQKAIAPYGFHQKQPDSFEKWEAGAGLKEHEWNAYLTPRSARDHLQELLMMGLRLREGLAKDRLGPQESLWARLFEKEQLLKNIEENADFYHSSAQGSQLLDSVLQNLFAEIEKITPQQLDLAHLDPRFLR
jgi:oxygen-independent coproporphyrinogen III oxidase